MATLDEIIAKSIQNMANLDSLEERQQLYRQANRTNLNGWRRGCVAKVASVGGLTGLSGGPWGVALEMADLSFLLASSGRACYGVGHILNRDVDYDHDIHHILAIWSGVAEASSDVAMGKVAVKVGGKQGLHLATKVGGKVIAKTALKSSPKVVQKIAAKASAKLLAKLTAKVSTKWIPFVGGVVSAGINTWVAGSLLDAAEQYYRHDYLLISNDLAGELA